jgi:RND family efflux transporter MFP subunit
MKSKAAIPLAGALLMGLAVAAAATLSLPSQEADAVNDPRQEPPIVSLATAVRAAGSKRGFTGIIAARVQSNLGFRLPGKIVERFVTAGQQVKAGQPLMRIDDTDLRLALLAKRKAVAAAHAVLVQATADERRYAVLVQKGLAATPQRYEQAKAALDIAEAQLAVAEAEVKVAENEAAYSVLVADTDGTVVETLAEPGQVVSAGQTVVLLAHAGPREAVVALPETVRPAIGSVAEASVYASDGRRFKAHLRQLSDQADAQTRTFEARYVLDGEAAAPLGATVTIRLIDQTDQAEVEVPLGALLDDGQTTGVWILDSATSTVKFRPVKLVRMTSETAVISGLSSGEPVVSLGAHLLKEGQHVRLASQGRADG